MWQGVHAHKALMFWGPSPGQIVCIRFIGILVLQQVAVIVFSSATCLKLFLQGMKEQGIYFHLKHLVVFLLACCMT